MKQKGRLVFPLLVAIMMVTIVFGLMDGKDAEAADVSVTMGSTVLANGYYYFDSSGNFVPCSDVSSISDYMQYQDGVLTIYGSVTGTLGGMQVSVGTLTMKGDGNLNLTFYGNLSGAGSIITDDYTGNITFRSPVTTPVNGLNSLQLRTTGTIVIESPASSLSSNSYAISTGSLVLEGASVILSNNPTITTTGNAEITATSGNLEFQAAFNQPLFLTNTPTAVFTLKAPNGSVLIDNSGTGSSLGVNGNLNVTAKNDVTIKASLQAVNGTANIESTEGNVMLSTSGNTSVVSGDLTVRASNGNVFVSGSAINGGSLIGNTDIQAKSKIDIKNGGSGITISGNAVLKSAEDEIKVKQIGAVPMVTGNLALSTPKLTKMERTTSSTNNLVGGTITSSDVIVLKNGSDTTYMSDGSATPTATCPHTRMDGTGTCIACGYQASVAAIVDANGTVKNTYTSLVQAFDPQNRNATDTIQILRDYKDQSLNLSGYSYSSYKEINIDLCNHELDIEGFDNMSKTTIKNGTLIVKSLRTANLGNESLLTLDNVNLLTLSLQWATSDGIVVTNGSQVKIAPDSNTYIPPDFKTQKIIFGDKNSRIELSGVPQGLETGYSIRKDATKDLKEYTLYSIKNLLPKGSEILEQINPYDPQVYNGLMVVDKNTQQPLQNLVLCYKNIADADVTVDASSIVYDGNAKKPTFTVKYGTEELEANVDFSTSYSGNTNAGRQAKITLTGNDVDSAYYGTKTIFFTIQKAPQAAPTGLVATAETIDGKNDGKIANLSVKMEYSVDNHTWIDANTQLLENLPDGDYYVRYKETNNYYASPSTKLVVAKGATPSTTGEQTTTERTTTTEKQTTVEETTTTGEQMTTERTTTTGEQATTQQTFVEQPDGATTQAGVPKTTEADKKTDKAVSTGDAYPIAIMITLLLGAGVGITGMIRRRKEK